MGLAGMAALSFALLTVGGRTRLDRGKGLAPTNEQQQVHSQPRLCQCVRLSRAQDNGKPLFYSQVADVPLSIDHFRYYAGCGPQFCVLGFRIQGTMITAAW